MAELVQERYARSLFEVAVDANCQEQTMNDLNLVGNVIHENPDFAKLLSAKTMNKQDLKNVISQVFEGQLSEFVTNMIKIMIDNGRIGLVSKVAESYKEIYYSYKGMLEITAITAVELSSTNRERLSKKLKELTGKDPIIENIIDESILGGIILKIKNEQIDNSVKGKLEDLKKQLSTLTI